MTRGKHSSARNAELRRELAEANGARHRLEGRLHDAERELAELRAWKADAKANAVPDVRAERRRNADLALRLTTALDEAKRQAQADLDEFAAIMTRSIRSGCGTEGPHGPRYTPDDIDRLTALVSPKELEALFRRPEIARQQRRDMARMPRWAKASLRDGGGDHG